MGYLYVSREGYLMKSILILEGYGAIEKKIALILDKEYPNKVIIAGRDLQKGQAFIINQSKTLKMRRLDASGATSLKDNVSDVDFIINTIDQKEPVAAQISIEKGLKYADVTALLLHTGLAPEISNVMAKTGKNALNQTDLIITIYNGDLEREALPNTLDYLLFTNTQKTDVLNADGSISQALTLTRSDFFDSTGNRKVWPRIDECFFGNIPGALFSKLECSIEPKSIMK